MEELSSTFLYPSIHTYILIFPFFFALHSILYILYNLREAEDWNGALERWSDNNDEDDDDDDNGKATMTTTMRRISI